MKVIKRIKENLRGCFSTHVRATRHAGIINNIGIIGLFAGEYLKLFE